MSQKTIFITGGNRGIGRGLVQRLCHEHHVIFTSRKHIDDVPTGSTCLIMDVTHDSSIKEATRQLTEPIDILINNAGILPDYQTSALEADIEMIEHTFSTNTLGPLRVAKAIVPKMNEGGRIINISSGMGQLSDMGSGAIAYRLSKTSLNALTRVLHNELKAKHISVNCLCPGWVKTDMGGPNAHRSIEDSIENIVPLLFDESIQGGLFYRDTHVIDW
ncbi:short-chain dehydrogenase [bacterium]|nr:short-chain dehydrogenase [bacterium]|tara:strand:- start:5717 stop:6370 length:654 start_codon:yes stop_codon:yes gene_type:complete